jgi:cation diffusion facilitator CzcD-associated flavoprotein CzcO
VVFLLYNSQNKLVQERIRNYIQKYAPLAQEFPAAELESIGAKPGTPKFEKARQALMAKAASFPDVDIRVYLDGQEFIAYGRWFQERLVPGVRRTVVELVQPTDDGFQLTLSSGDTLRARRVVVASGLRGFAHVPAPLRGLSAGVLSHSYDHGGDGHDGLERLADQSVVVLGAGQSALETATLLHEQGSSVTLVARSPNLVWNSVPQDEPRRLRSRLRYPRSGLGDGKAHFVYAKAPLAFHALPEARDLHPAIEGGELRVSVAATQPRLTRT